MRRHNPDTLWRLYEIGGAELALRYAELSEEAHEKTLDVIRVRFFGGGIPNSGGAAREYASRFPFTSTKRVHCQIDLRNPWKYTSFGYSLVTRWTGPDGGLIKETRDRVETNPEWETFSFTVSHQPEGQELWSLGSYRVEVVVDDQYRDSGEFSVFLDPLVNPFKFQPSRPLIDPTSPSLRRPFAQDFFKSFTPSDEGRPAMSDKHEQEETPQGLGLAGWLDRLNRQFPVDSGSDELVADKPLDDMAKMRRLMAIDRRYMAVMPRAQIGLANASVLQELEAIAADYRKLLQAGAPTQSLFYTENKLRTKIADTATTAAQVCEILDDYPAAERQYAAAERIYEEVGDRDKLQRCRADRARLKFGETGDFNSEIKRLRAELNTQKPNSIGYAETLIELAGIYGNNNDDTEAEKLLKQAKGILDGIEHMKGVRGDPTGGDLGTALVQTMQRMLQDSDVGGSPSIVEMMRVSGLYRQLYLQLARIYDTKDPVMAADYRDKATQRDSRAYNDIFSDVARRALEDR